ncbi:MAG: phosphoribosylamine--glycine ligase [Oscillospiraceae bacterium]|jgi:phosphoribosylamine--glycine ligase|nr:phosphoribosylamine--glycine ligase [Oscillospiraceae bacterium]
MKILVIGGGGREHALIKSIKKSPKASKIYCLPGNGGISCDAECVDIPIASIERVVQFAVDTKIDLCVVAPDDPLAAGMVDALQNAGVRAFGPNKNAAIIEASKVFSKDLMQKYGIPTAKHKSFTNAEDAYEFLKTLGNVPVVVKADGLALGKGVIICSGLSDAIAAVKEIMEDKKFGSSGSSVVIEEFLTGVEVSVLAFCDSKTVVPMVSSRDHKRALDGNKGLNTGGMGTISPNPFYTDSIANECMEKIFLPTINAMNAEGRTFKGCLYFGLMLTENGPKVIEYNARFGDPEAQVVLPRLQTDIIDIMEAVIDERLPEVEICWSDNCAVCVVMASGGYPENYEKGVEIFGLDANTGGIISSDNFSGENITVYHSGTKKDDSGRFFTNGGRVLGVTAVGDSLDEAINHSYEAVGQISFKDAHYRTDIGK